MKKREAERAVAYLEEMAPDLRGCAVFDGQGNALAATGDPSDWAEPAQALFRAAEEDDGEPASHVHVGTEEGEVFAVRHGDYSMVAVAERFTLASLMIFDMRSLLRDVAGTTAAEGA